MKRFTVILGSTVILLAILVWVVLLKASGGEEEPAETDPVETKVVKESEMLYDIPVDSFEVITGVIGRNQLLGNILHPLGVSDRQIFEISRLPEKTFDVKRLRYGNKYAIFLSPDSLREVVYFVYERDLASYDVLHFSDSIHAESRNKPVRIETRQTHGEIQTSLWEAFRDLDVSPFLALELSEIYAWSIDFFGLQKGDRFKVVYDESYVDTVSAGVVKIHGAWFHHDGKEFWAIPFKQDGTWSYYDEEGNSLRKAFLKAPLRFSRISSRFSYSRMHPILKIRRTHLGVDYAAPSGTPVQTVGDGKVIKATYGKGAGYYIKVRHNGIYTTVYMHLSRFARGIKTGTWVTQGDVIGYVGSTGLSTGPHLDFRFYKNGQAVDPLKVEAPPVEPVFEENREAYERVKQSTMAALNSIH